MFLCPSLTQLSLRNNRIGDEGARLIGSALSTPTTTNKNLLSLNLAFNSIGDAGAAHIARVCPRADYIYTPPRMFPLYLLRSSLAALLLGPAAESDSARSLAGQQSDRRLGSCSSR